MKLEQRVEELEKDVSEIKKATQQQAARLKRAAEEAANYLASKTMPIP